jgi:bifunctional non-homologous end joining protein LigD
MSLKEYKRKRDFRRTPEPAGNGAKSAPGRQFVVQKHAARRLHYDFRLELAGTLKSWAVPKGPSLDPGVKSLAVQVEDHPLEYATFEGVIPQGEYGGGTVMVWDHGTWEPEADPDKGLKQGKLKFKLNGEKLHGSWALVRMGGSAGEDGKNWLLIKHRDDEARPAAKLDVLKRKPRSVLSGREMDQIAEDADRVWSSNRQAARKPAKKTSAAKVGSKTKRAASRKPAGRAPIDAKELSKLSGARRAPLPDKFQPQLATLASRVPEGDDWLHELKFDGYRILARVEKGEIRLVTRRANDWTARFRSVADALEELPVNSAILDGELVSLDEQGLSNFQQLQNSMNRGKVESIVYYVFDVPYLDGFDLAQLPLVERKEVLARLLLSTNPKNDGTVRYSDHIRGRGEEVLQYACRGAMEGIVSKRADSLYQQYRSSSWLKVKCLKEQEFVIGGYTKPEGSREGFGALLVGYYDKGDLNYAGRVGTGFTSQSLRELTAELKQRRVDSPPFKNPPTGSRRRGVNWVRPELVAQVAFSEWTSDGRLRQPSFQGLREDKPAKEVVRELAKSPPDIERRSRSRSSSVQADTVNGQNRTRGRKPKAPGSSHAASREVVVAGVRITNPDRVLYPEQGLTKRDLAEFYERIADWVLPYVVNRPLTLVRCPEGHTGECFYQKHLTGYMPEAVEGVRVKEKGKSEEYVMIRDLAGLISLVQMGVLEIHPWPARVDKLERPDYLVFDLDPGEGVEWKAVVAGAREVKERLEGAGLRAFLRTSGGKGLHVVVPLQRRNTWDELKQFAKSVADTMTRDAPDRYLATMSKAKRRGKVYIDYLRNQRGATAIASYSTRARDGAAVATPISWEELTATSRADKYNVSNLPKRLGKLSRDPWEGFFSVRQSLTREVQSAFA